MTTFRLNGADAGAVARGFTAPSDAFFPDPAKEAQALYYASGSRFSSARAADQEMAPGGRWGMADSIRAGVSSADVFANAADAGGRCPARVPGPGAGQRLAARRPGPGRAARPRSGWRRGQTVANPGQMARGAT